MLGMRHLDSLTTVLKNRTFCSRPDTQRGMCKDMIYICRYALLYSNNMDNAERIRAAELLWCRPVQVLGTRVVASHSFLLSARGETGYVPKYFGTILSVRICLPDSIVIAKDWVVHIYIYVCVASLPYLPRVIAENIHFMQRAVDRGKKTCHMAVVDPHSKTQGKIQDSTPRVPMQTS